MTDTVVSAVDLRKMYGEVTAADGITFSVERGEIFGIVGPNGAGKTTTMDCIVGMRKPDSGSATVLGMDPRREGMRLRQKLGIQQQESELPDRIRVREAMELFSSFYARTLDWRGLLDELRLTEKSESFFSELSGGQKKRLFVALALVGDPEIVFLDELTSGLDPQARRSIWDLVRKLRDEGRTVVLSTHYMDEVERLCDRVAIIDRGRIVALDAPGGLTASLGGDLKVRFSVVPGFPIELLERIEGVDRVVCDGASVTVGVSRSRAIVDIVNLLDGEGCSLDGFRTERVTLEDVFLAVTGREVRS
jgi:ABC-2 type transport system ATP-binding protein